MTDHTSLPGTASELAALRCRNGAPKLPSSAIVAASTVLPGWSISETRIDKTFLFDDFHATIEFVNALAWIANHEDHHPDLRVSYNRCVVSWSTHDAGGITRNDIICAAKTDRLING